MSKFETIGVQRLFETHSKAELLDSFEHSCDCCCNCSRCLFADCAGCHIRGTYRQLAANYADRAKADRQKQMRKAVA